MEITKKRLADLKPLEKNIRVHNSKQIQEFVKSLNQVGQIRAFVIDEDNNILVGNGMYQAMIERGDVEGDCYVLRGLTEAQKKKVILSDNKIYRLGTDDFEAINDYLQEIAGTGDFQIPGFEEDIVKKLIADISVTDSDIGSYGSIPDRPFSTTVQEPDYTPAGAGVHAGAEDSGDVAPTPSNAGRTMIVCPNCGEVIYLD